LPFEQMIPRPFTNSGVAAYAPSSSGIYGISNGREWIFIGESDNIRDTLLGHLQDAGSFLLERTPTGFVYELCGLGGRSGRHDRLILEYEPICNRRSSSWA